MNEHMPQGTKKFHPIYLRDFSDETMSASVFGVQDEDEQAAEISPLRSTGINIHISKAAGSSIVHQYMTKHTKQTGHQPRSLVTLQLPSVSQSFVKAKATKEMEPYYGGKTYDFLTAGSFSLWFDKIHQIDLEKVVISEERAKVKETRGIHLSYVSRIEFLREEASEEGITFNENSELDFWKFIASIPFVRKGRLFLMDNGDLRAVWDDNEDNLVGLQFLGDSSVRYVIFKRRTESGFVSRVAGSDTLNSVIAQIKAFELDALLSA